MRDERIQTESCTMAGDVEPPSSASRELLSLPLFYGGLKPERSGGVFNPLRDGAE
jgi:hypothetical protein